MRILHVASGDLWAGAEVSVHHIVLETARRNGCAVHAALLNDGMLAKRLMDAGVPVEIVPERGVSFPRIAVAVTEIARRFRAEVIHTHRYKEDLLGAVAAARTGALHVRTAHGRTPVLAWRSGPVGVGSLLNDAVANWCGSVWIAVSDDLATSLRGLRRSVHVIPNGIPAGRPEPARAELLAACGVRDAVVVGFVGRLEPVKRPDRFLRLVRALPGNVQDRPVVAVLLGSGSLWATIGTAVREATGGPRTVLLDPVEQGERLVAALDVLVIPSDHEGLPMVLLEAMRSSVSVVATRVGGMIEVLGTSRWLVPPDDEATLAARVRELVSSPASRAAWGQDLHSRFVVRYTIEATVDRILDVYACERGAVESAESGR